MKSAIKKRVLMAVLCLAFTLSALPARAASLSNLTPIRRYYMTFGDIAAYDWFYESVVAGYEYGYFDGFENGAFFPGGTVTVAETIKLAACIRSVYETGSAPFTNGEPWYEPYTVFAISRKIIETGQFTAMDAPITRADFALILSQALPEDAYAVINEIADDAIPDVPSAYSYADSVYMLYRAGILTGSDAKGTFYPNRSITRAEAAAIAARIVKPDSRVSLPAMRPALTGETIFNRCSPAVFLIEIYDENGEVERSGSGFFISPDGLAVTNCHVAVNILSAKAVMSNGESYDITGIYDRDMATDSALIKVDGENFPFLEVRDSSTLKTGEEVYTISSPVGLLNSISRGIISASSREIDGTTFIQIDAAISQGSSGGALIDSRGFAVGITSAAVNGGESLNLAMPINVIDDLDGSEFVSFEQYERALPYYYGFFPAPDYGKYAGVQPLVTEKFAYAADYYYRLPAYDKREELIEGYAQLLEENGFVLYFSPSEENNQTIYINYMYGISVLYGETTYNGVKYFMVELMN